MQLVNNESALKTYVSVFNARDIVAATAAVKVASIPAGGACAFAYCLEETAIAGASDITLSVGTTVGAPTEFINAWDADLGTPAVNTGTAMVQTAGNTTYEAGWLPAAPTATAQTVYALFGGTIANVTAGKVIVVVGIIDPGQFAS